jgi:hypothetical protein
VHQLQNQPPTQIDAALGLKVQHLRRAVVSRPTLPASERPQEYFFSVLTFRSMLTRP